jgi:hypothetical protein
MNCPKCGGEMDWVPCEDCDGTGWSCCAGCEGDGGFYVCMYCYNRAIGKEEK